jgi:hypothetical protein
MFTDQQFYDLFEDIAKKNKAIAHSSGKKRFYKSPDEIPEKELPRAIHLVLLPPEYEYADRDSDNIIERFRGTFLLFKPTERENFAAELASISECRVVARQILAMLKKKRNDKIFHEFTIGNSKGEPIGPILENCHGVSYSFTIGDGAGIVFDPSNWIE